MKFTKLFPIAAFVFAVTGASAQKKSTTKTPVKTSTQPKVTLPYETSASGVKYKMHKDVAGRTAVEGDIIEFNLINKNAKDSILFSTYETGSALPLQIMKPEYKGDLMSGFMLLSAGDSATFWLDVDSIRGFEPIPGVLDKGSMMRYSVKINNVYTQEEYKAKMAQAGGEQLKTDTVAIKKYLADNKIKNYSRTAEGLYYVIDTKGPDANAKPGNGKKVKVHYTGTLLNGQKFDSSRDRNQPFEFTLGVGQVIRGWDEGIALLSKGSRGRLFIPSQMGYGPQGAGAAIPANAVLIFDVELLDF
ncbi:MAG: FKBP-type peptidyl-prolyl cis-trans isomerase [Sphingobacteriales bacterium]|nr:MAG: FKBP-type peptidyl-prolyl cis-trans isomerase [Sphingobacteriales bacterium]